MRIFTKKSFEFENAEEKVVTSPLAIQDVPAWVKDNWLFKMAKKDGDVEIIGSAKDEKNAGKVNKSGEGNSGNATE